MSDSTETQRLELLEVEMHTIKVDPSDSVDQKLDKIIVNLNGKTIALAKVRSAQTKLMKLQPLILDHQKRFEKFDETAEDAREWLRWARSFVTTAKDDVYSGIRKAFVIFVCVVILYFVLYPLWNHINPNHTLPTQSITPSPSS